LRTFEPSGFEFGWPSLHTFTECAAAVVCIDCTTSTRARRMGTLVSTRRACCFSSTTPGI
jgi:hypothetical protein